MSLAVILVLLEGIESDETVAETALAIGAAYEARVDGLIVRPDPRETVRLAFDGMSSSMIEGIIPDRAPATDTGLAGTFQRCVASIW